MFIEIDQKSQNILANFVKKIVSKTSVTRLGDLLLFENFVKPVATIILPKLPTF